MSIGTDLAFPVVGEPRMGCDGLTKREYIAARAMQGILADPRVRGDLSALAPDVATESVAFADALLAELAK